MKPMTDGEAARQIQAAKTSAMMPEALTDILTRAGYEDAARSLDAWQGFMQDEIDEANSLANSAEDRLAEAEVKARQVADKWSEISAEMDKLVGEL